MPTAVDLVNQALVELGGRPEVESLTDTASDSARIANAVYATVRDTLLQQHPWNFAMARAEVEADDTDPDFGWSKRYALPDDCLRVWRLSDEPTNKLGWAVEGGWLLTDEASPIELRYIARVEDPDDWSPAFQRAVIGELAAAMAMAISNTAAVAQAARQTAAIRLEEARSLDGRERGKTRWPDGRLKRAFKAAAGG